MWQRGVHTGLKNGMKLGKLKGGKEELLAPATVASTHRALSEMIFE